MLSPACQGCKGTVPVWQIQGYHAERRSQGRDEMIVTRWGGQVMPIVRVEMFSGRTHAQKQELARAITEAVANIAHTTPEATIVVFQDVERENWAQAGKLASDED
jgi:4-oxalocrotonate tautomerase